jgi:hypothetical protein
MPDFLARLRSWAEADDGKPVYMLELMRFLPQLRPFDGAPDYQGTPEQANRYYEKRVALLLRASSVFGRPCETPNFERLANGGLRYNRFHTTALCAASRAAMLTGRNHHSVGMGAVTELATSAPGNNSLRSNTKAPLAQTLQMNGYSTAQFGKCHEVPVFQSSSVGPFAMWPTGSGFEYFYGFIGGEDNQWYPSLYEGTTPVEPPKTPEEGYHLTEDLADHAVTWVRTQRTLAPDKLFFMYFAPGATHAPHHVPEEWIEKYKGRFAHGWDEQRKRTFASQKELGIIPREADLTQRHEEIPAWDEMPEELKNGYSRRVTRADKRGSSRRQDKVGEMLPKRTESLLGCVLLSNETMRRKPRFGRRGSRGPNKGGVQQEEQPAPPGKARRHHRSSRRFHGPLAPKLAQQPRGLPEAVPLQECARRILREGRGGAYLDNASNLEVRVTLCAAARVPHLPFYSYYINNV